MKQKHLQKLWLRVGMIVAVMTTALAGTVKAESYTITFNSQGQGDGTSVSTSTDCSTIVSAGESYLSGKVAQATYAYHSGQFGLKLGKSGYAGSIKLNLANSVTPTSIVVSAKRYSSSKPVTLSVNGSPAQDLTINFADYTFDISDEISYIQLNSSNYSWIKSITVNYTSGGSTLADSDLALTNAPVALNFDLYNNAKPQTINFTTSSTGAVTVSESEYVTTSVNGNTITVTPVKVTPSAQTITVSQAADDTYAEGSATFTVNVTNSIPFVGSIFIFNTDAGLQDLGINKPSSGNGTNLNVNTDYTIDNVTMNVTHGGTATRVWNSNGSTDLRVYKSGGSLTFTVPIGYKINKITFTGSSVNFSNVTNNVWQGTPASSVTLSATNTSNITTITVEYEVSNDPVLSADDINIACNAVEGVITYTLTNPAANGVLTASTTSDWLTIGTVGETISFTCETNTTATVRTANLTITYTYGDSQSVTKEVAVTQEGKKDAGLAYATTSVTKFEGDANFTNTLTNPNSLNVTYASSEESVATIDNNGEVTILAAGTTTITASYSGDEIYLSGSANYTLTVNEPFVAEDGVFDFVEAAGQGYDYGSGVPIAHGSNGNYIYEDKTWTAGNVTLVSSGKYRWWYNGYELRFYKTDGDNEAIKESAMTISVPEGKVITSIEVFGGKNWETDCGSYSDGKWTGSSQTVVFTYSGTNSNNVTKVVVTYSETESVSVGDLKYSTYASDNALDFTGSSIKAFYPTVDGSTLIFHEITKVPARTGVLLYSANGAVTEDILVCTGETDAVENNVFVRGTGASVSYNDITQDYIYVLSKPQGDNLGFYKANKNKVATNRAYIQVPAELSGAKSFTINLEDDPTGIIDLNANLNANEGIYNLAGQRLSKMQKGINIINGKKVLK